MRVADFFCGAGGFSEGFRQAGFEICFAVDKWEPAVTTYKANKPFCKVILDDVIRISNLEDSEFERLVPDTEVIIGSPPCVAFSNSNKSGNGDKELGIKLLEAYLRIVARKKFKKGSILRYWALENVPNIERFIKPLYTAGDLGIAGKFELRVINDSAGVYNAKYYGAPTNRTRYLCGEFPKPQETHDESNIVKLRTVLDSLGNYLQDLEYIVDCNYPDLVLPKNEVSDYRYTYELQPFEWETAKRLKQDKGYMGKMAFPENVDKPARTVMATMSASSRESMIFGYGESRYRLPTVREVASLMSFPIDYRFYGKSKGIKYTLVGNAVPPKLSNAVAKAILRDAGCFVLDSYPKINHDYSIPFIDLNDKLLIPKAEKKKKLKAKFRYHIPYLIINAYRVEFTNYNSDFDNSNFRWDVELHYSQGKNKAKVYLLELSHQDFEIAIQEKIRNFIGEMKCSISSFNELQNRYIMTSAERFNQGVVGPYEILNKVREFIDSELFTNAKKDTHSKSGEVLDLPESIRVGYYILQVIIKMMGGDSDGCEHS